MSAIDDARKRAAERAWSYRNRNAALALPSTRNIDAALVEAVRATLARRGIDSPESLEPGSFEHEIVSRVLRALSDARFDVQGSREARDRVQRRLGMLR